MVFQMPTLPGMPEPISEPITINKGKQETPGASFKRNRSNQPEQSPLENPVASVILMTNQLGLVNNFDYLVPPKWDDQCKKGSLVRVRVGKRLLSAIVAKRQSTTSFSGRLREISSITCSTPMLTETGFRLLNTVARHYGTFPASILRFVLPPGHSAAEKEFLSKKKTSNTEITNTQTDQSTSFNNPWEYYQGGTDFYNSLAKGTLTRAVWTTLPHPSALNEEYSWERTLFQAVDVQIRAGKQVLILVPTLDDILHFQNIALQYFGQKTTDTSDEKEDRKPSIEIYHSCVGQKAQFLTYLRAGAGQIDLLIASRAGAWLPMARPGLMVIVDGHHIALRETKNPGISARQVLLYRSEIEKVSILLLGYTLPAADCQLVEKNWAMRIDPPRKLRRQLGARIHLMDKFDQSVQGTNATLTLPTKAIKIAKHGLADGPVLIQVPFSGYQQVISCGNCAAPLACQYCAGPLERRMGNNLVCKWCARLYPESSRCSSCGSHLLRIRTVGAGRIGEELGRLFPQTPIMLSSNRDGKLSDLDNASRVVLATAGAEPPVPGGYKAGLILEPQALDGRTELWVPREVMRRFLGAAVLLSPQAPLFIAGPIRPSLGQYLVRTDVWAAGTEELSELRQTGFPPAQRVALLRGSVKDLNKCVQYLKDRISNLQILGPVEETPQIARVLVRVRLSQGQELGVALQNLQLIRHGHQDNPIRISIDPDNPA